MPSEFLFRYPIFMNIYKNINDLPAFKNPVITIGSFDGVHAGHQKILSRVKTLADEINGESVVITFFPHPRKIVDPREQGLSVLNTLDEKIGHISSLGIGNIVIVPFTFEFSRLSPREYIEKFILGCFHPKYVVIGYDHKFGLNRAGDIHLFKDYESAGHFHVIEIPKQEVDEVTVSSTKIRSAILSGKIEDASLLLNHPYILTGKVIHGDKLGTKLGYPTANLYISEKEKLIPMEGVYAVKTEIEDEEFDGMMYIGKKPTVSDQAGINIEINIFDFNQNIYDKTIKINIIKYLRNDLKFDSLDQLKEQLAIDEKNAIIALDSLKTFDKKHPIVTIAILNYNGSELLESYLPMIEFSSEKYEFDILVIDNKSEDLSVDFVKEWYPEIRVAELSKNYGFADGYNKGLKDVHTDYVVIINSDVLVTENWLDPIIEALEADKELGIVQPMILSMEDKTKFEYAGAAGGYIDVFGFPFCRGRIFNHVEFNENQYEDNAEIFWASGAALVCRTKVFKSLGGFDGSFFAHQEEIDLCWRFRQAGYNIKCISTSKVYHLGGGTLDYNNPKKDFLNFRNNLYLLTKNEHLINLLWLIPAKLILDGIAGLKFLLDGKFRSTIAIIKAHMSYYKHLPLVFERRNLEQNLIFRNKINKPDLNGIFFGSIVWKYYIERIKKFTDLNF
ncbi:MAG: bifunctional riboflavin kinase/FAD synthetase [Saprospiraceae bacterium]|nr:bifunctional riboflavin kinase/FAD synthetase [Saprospiraceae bacterium]